MNKEQYLANHKRLLVNFATHAGIAVTLGELEGLDYKQAHTLIARRLNFHSMKDFETVAGESCGHYLLSLLSDRHYETAWIRHCKIKGIPLDNSDCQDYNTVDSLEQAVDLHSPG